MSALLFCPVPGGLATDGSALLRVVVVPRLDSGTVASNGLASWPPAELRAPLTVTLTPATGAAVTVEVTPRLQDQEGLWPQVFGRATVSPALHRTTADDLRPVTVSPTSRSVSGVHESFSAAARAYARVAASDPATGRDAYAAAVTRELQSPTWAPPVISLGPPAALADTPLQSSVPPTDIHRIYGMLREHPRVLAALGLIIELDLPPGTVPAGGGTVRVDWPAAEAVAPTLPQVTPRSTAYDAETFLPAALDATDIDHGVVRLDDATRWQLAAVDAESAALRMGAPTRSGPDAVLDVLPALRTAGLLLLRVGRQQTFDTRRARSLAVAADADPVLYAEDLVLGYRIDVREAGDTQWRPLCAREATYRIDDTLVGAERAPEEGHVKVHSAVRDPSNALQADEVVTRWDGWSLAVPRPFPLRTPGRPGSGDAPSEPVDPTALAYRLTTDFAVPPGSLPPLRFGSSYEVRARVADIAGGGVPADAATGDDHPATAFRFTRYEPVSSPGLAPLDGDDGADLGPGVHVAQLAVTSAGGDPSGGALEPTTSGQTQRTLSRPTASLTTADWHGALGGDPDQTWPLVQLAAAQQLPDPAAAGLSASVVADSGAPAVDPVTRPWPAWPDTHGTTVQVQAADGNTPVLAWTDNGLVVSLAPAQEVTIQIASTVAAADLQRLAVSGWSDPTVAHGNDAGLTAVMIGQHPMVTPATTLSCVHAVRRPLQGARGDITLDRSQGLSATLAPTLPVFGVDTASTGQLDVSASWTEVSDGPEVAQADAPSRQLVADMPLQSVVVHPGDTTVDAVQHHLTDSRHRQVTYQISAVSRFRGFFAEGPDDSFAAPPLSVTLDVPSTERPAPPKLLGVVPAFVWERTTVGSTITHVRKGNRIRVELDRPWFDSGDDERIALVMTRAARLASTIDVTELGRDPAMATATPARYPHASGVLGSGDAVATVVRAVDGQEVDVVPAEVFYDAAAGHWFADFALPAVAGGSYWPMLRPAFARYQRHSLPGQELSDVVIGDFVPLLPDRTLTVAVQGSQITVTLSGMTPQSTSAQGNVVHVAFEPWTDDITPALLREAIGPGPFPSIPDVGYGAVGDPITYTVPSDRSIGRIRVHEVEGTHVPDPLTEPPQLGAMTEAGSRVVFVDVVVLPQPSAG